MKSVSLVLYEYGSNIENIYTFIINGPGVKEYESFTKKLRNLYKKIMEKYKYDFDEEDFQDLFDNNELEICDIKLVLTNSEIIK